MGEQIVASAERIKSHRCENCNSVYWYAMRRRARAPVATFFDFSSASARQEATEQAVQRLEERFAREADTVPCPECGWYQKRMVVGRQRVWFYVSLISSVFIALVVMVTVIALHNNGAVGSPVPSIGAGLIVMLLGFIVSLVVAGSSDLNGGHPGQGNKEHDRAQRSRGQIGPLPQAGGERGDVDWASLAARAIRSSAEAKGGPQANELSWPAGPDLKQRSAGALAVPECTRDGDEPVGANAVGEGKDAGATGPGGASAPIAKRAAVKASVCKACETSVIPTDSICPACRQVFEPTNEFGARHRARERSERRTPGYVDFTGLDWIAVLLVPPLALILGAMRLLLGDPRGAR